MKIPLFEAQTEWNEPEEYPDLESMMRLQLTWKQKILI